jgi:hypothetical protein
MTFDQRKRGAGGDTRTIACGKGILRKAEKRELANGDPSREKKNEKLNT